jgi:DoxX-like protein
MGRKIAYWASTALIALSAAMAAFAYLSGSSQAVQGFIHINYPQQLRVILGIAKPMGAIFLLVPGFLRLKEWAYAGFTFAWICAFIAHTLAHDGGERFAPIVLLILLAISYTTRPANRKLAAEGRRN